MRNEFTKFTTTAAATLAENIDTANERALEAVIDANRRFVEFAVTAADRVADQIPFELPFADRLPRRRPRAASATSTSSSVPSP